jgi:hypothetical protein
VYEYKGTDEGITLGDKKEFIDRKWITMDELASIVVDFKKPVYQELGKELDSYRARESGKST